eukprot:TRINITY_DN18810_c0_g1_i1.p1 TRINITY_DN18810_c0_g1~~TRINITY_DN18810_c0_g1_i1.p1  ORF type:complete len:268 (-),score=23.23 TRINITY_DN18810_c0_g1_i1:248-1051(-)
MTTVEKVSMAPRPGFRVFLSMSGHVPCVFLLTVVPVYAYVVGDIMVPNLMVSDLIAAGPVYKALFTFSFCYNVYGVSMAWTDCMRNIRLQAPALAPAVNRFLGLFHGLGCPCLLLLTAFPFDAETSPTVSPDASYFEQLPMDLAGFVTWLVHVVAASLFFIGAAGCAAIVGIEMAPHLQSKNLMHPKDLAWITFAAKCILFGFSIITIFRMLHIMHKPQIWIWPLALTEVFLILCCLMVNSLGTLRMLAELDERDPIVELWPSRSKQ